MIDLFTTLHSSDLGTLAIDYAHDPSVVGPDSPPRPPRFDVASPTLPPRPQLFIELDVYVSGPTIPPQPTKLVPTLYLDVVGPDLPPRPK